MQGFTGPSSTIPVPAVADQLALFLSGTSPQGTPAGNASLPGDFDSPLFVIWAGANDVFFNSNISAAQSYLEIAAAAAALRAAYPDPVRVLTVASPDLARLPYGFYADDLTRSQLTSFTTLLASLLADGARLSADVEVVDLTRLFESFEYFAQPQKYGFGALGKYGSCLVGIYGEGAPGMNGMFTQCDDMQERVFWDEYQCAITS